jgi:hypothetical protein
MDYITLTPTLRVRDYDTRNYVIERATVVETGKNAGNTVWVADSYVGSVKSLATMARRVVVGDAVREARDKAMAEFDASGIADVLTALPPKVRSK